MQLGCSGLHFKLAYNQQTGGGGSPDLKTHTDLEFMSVGEANCWSGTNMRNHTADDVLEDWRQNNTQALLQTSKYGWSVTICGP